MPDATLDICSYHTFPSSIDDVEMNNIILQHNSITHHGRLNTSELYKLMSISEYWLYTNTVPESSCITALEMLMNKVICLYYPLGFHYCYMFLLHEFLRITRIGKVIMILELSKNFTAQTIIYC